MDIRVGLHSNALALFSFIFPISWVVNSSRAFEISGPLRLKTRYSLSSSSLACYSEGSLLNLLFYTAVHERLLRTSDDFVWPIDTTFQGRFIIDVEFLDLKIGPVNVSYFKPDVI